MASAPEVKLGVVQANESPAAKRSPDSLRRQLALTKTLPTDELDLVVWSESAVPGVLDELEAPQELYRRILRHVPAPFVLGAVLVDRAHDETRRVNTALSADADGRICSNCRYDKQLLFPVGEFIPFARWVPSLGRWFPNSGSFGSSERSEPLPVGARRVAVSICYDSPVRPFSWNRRSSA